MIIASSKSAYIEKKITIKFMEQHFDSVIVHYNNGTNILIQSDSDYVEFVMNHEPSYFTEWHFSEWENAVASARYYVDLMLEEF